MRKRIRWFVVAGGGYLWQFGRWTRTPDTDRASVSHAVLHTKRGAYRCARRSPVPATIICRYKDGAFREFRSGV